MVAATASRSTDQAVKDARRQELDAAIGLAVAILCGPLGILFCLRSLGRIHELTESLQERSTTDSVQPHLVTARAVALVGLVISVAAPIAVGIWFAILAQLQS